MVTRCRAKAGCGKKKEAVPARDGLSHNMATLEVVMLRA